MAFIEQNSNALKEYLQSTCEIMLALFERVKNSDQKDPCDDMIRSKINELSWHILKTAEKQPDVLREHLEFVQKNILEMHKNLMRGGNNTPTNSRFFYDHAGLLAEKDPVAVKKYFDFLQEFDETMQLDIEKTSKEDQRYVTLRQQQNLLRNHMMLVDKKLPYGSLPKLS